MQSARPHKGAYLHRRLLYQFASYCVGQFPSALQRRTSAFSNVTQLEYIALLLAATVKVYAVSCMRASHTLTPANNRQYDMKHISSGIAIPGKGALPEASVGICARVAFVGSVSETVSVLQSDLHVREL